MEQMINSGKLTLPMGNITVLGYLFANYYGSKNTQHPFITLHLSLPASNRKYSFLRVLIVETDGGGACLVQGLRRRLALPFGCNHII